MPLGRLKWPLAHLSWIHFYWKHNYYALSITEQLKSSHSSHFFALSLKQNDKASVIIVSTGRKIRWNLDASPWQCCVTTTPTKLLDSRLRHCRERKATTRGQGYGWYTFSRPNSKERGRVLVLVDFGDVATTHSSAHSKGQEEEERVEYCLINNDVFVVSSIHRYWK